jgi:hypothetical protein
MVDIFDIPLYYISFEQNGELEQYYRDKGFKKINFFKAIDGRKFDPTN